MSGFLRGRQTDLLIRPHRLAVRTHGSHPCNIGSIPVGAAD